MFTKRRTKSYYEYSNLSLHKDDLEIIKKGMHIIGKNLKYIRKKDFESLKEKVVNKIRILQFSEGLYNLILKCAAEKLADSKILSERLLDAAEIYMYLSNKGPSYIELGNRSKKLEKIYLINEIYSNSFF